MVERDVSSHLSKSKLERSETPFEMGRFACVLFLLLFTLIVSFIFNPKIDLVIEEKYCSVGHRSCREQKWDRQEKRLQHSQG